MDWKKSKFMQGRNILPLKLKSGMNISEMISNYENSSFEARNVAKGARLYEYMVKNDDVIWLGIAGAVVLGGKGGRHANHYHARQPAFPGLVFVERWPGRLRLQGSRAGKTATRFRSTTPAATGRAARAFK